MPDDDRERIDVACGKLIQLWSEIDEAADAGRKSKPLAIYRKYESWVQQFKPETEEYESEGGHHEGGHH